jgi:hypothetical protein
VQIASLVSDIGYDAAVKTAAAPLMITICVPSLTAETQGRISQALESLSYIASSTPDLENKEIRIKYDQTKRQRSADIIADLAKAGVTGITCLLSPLFLPHRSLLGT